MKLCFMLCILCVIFCGCRLFERAGEAAQTPSPMLGGQTPIQVTLKGAESLVQGNWLEGAIQLGLAAVAIVAGTLGAQQGVSAKRQVRKLRRANGMAASLAPAIAAVASAARKGAK